MSMRAAVVRSFDRPPHYEDFDTPVPAGTNEALVDVLAVGLHPRVRTGASGRHYTSTGTLPMIPGIDGVGRLEDGQVVYFVAPDDTWGSMADQAVVDLRRTIPLPGTVDVTKVAAVMNPAMAAWAALRRRVPLRSGQSVLVLGATGSAGSMAVQVAKHLGAGRVVGAGRDRERLASAAAEVDIVLVYLWGEPATIAIMALLGARSDRTRAMDWVQIGAMAGPTIELPSVALRSANLRLQGNGQGAVSTQAYLAELPSLVEEIAGGTIDIDVRTVPLADVEATWEAPEVPGCRTVLVP